MARRQSIAKRKAREAVLAQRRQESRKGTAQQAAAHFLRARYDAAQTTPDNARWWGGADDYSARTANRSGVRRTLRKRARYETENNSYAKGMERTIADHTIGSGPKLQMTGIRGDLASEVERKFREWCDAVDLTTVLRTQRMARTHDGESFLRLLDNPRLADEDMPVTLFLRLYEAEQCATPMQLIADEERAIDGIEFDEYGLPKLYHLLHTHPGGSGLNFGLQATDVPAQDMIHDFRPERPGQARGIPEITPALSLYALLRDYTLATIDAAKAAAYFTAILYTRGGATNPDTGDMETAADVKALEDIYLTRNALTTMPAGWELGQIKAEHPNAQFEQFHAKILQEIARCLSIPYNIAAGNSENMNYASGRLDHQNYFHSINVDRARIGRAVLDRIFSAWVQEAILTEGYLSQPLRHMDTDWAHAWSWDGFGHVDPVKEAKGQEIRLQSRTTSPQVENAKEGRDWEEIQDQNIMAELRYHQRRKEMADEMGIDLPDPATDANQDRVRQPIGADEDEEEDE